MPIRPENKARCPKDWKRIADAIRERAGDRCEGSPAYPDCRVPNGAVGYRVDGRWVQIGESIDDAGLASDAALEDGHRVVRIVLTVAHLDHTPENCDDDNLKAMCQRCHLTYDAEHHRQTAYATRKAAANTDDMFRTTSPSRATDGGFPHTPQGD